jgi:peroxiredoxin Q/BCP
LLADVGGNVAKQFGVKRSLEFLKVKRSTFVISRDRKIVDIINSEINMNAHAERALDALKTLAN